MSDQRKKAAQEYFTAFHNGELEKVYTFFNETCTVQYALEAPVPAKDFFPQAKELISTLHFETHGVYTAEDADNIIIHFSFSPKSEPSNSTEAIDIISFDENDKITNVKVIPNAKPQ